jgi:hypothetical protein
VTILVIESSGLSIWSAVLTRPGLQQQRNLRMECAEIARSCGAAR